MTSDSYLIQQLGPHHAADISEFVRGKIEEYSKQSIELKALRFFVKFSNKSFVEEKLFSREYMLWGCFYKKNLVGLLGTGTLCNINILFIKENVPEQEIAHALFCTMLIYYKQNKKYKKIKCNAPLFQKHLFTRLGFEEVLSGKSRNGCIQMEYGIKR